MAARTQDTPGAPPAFGTSPAVGPPVSAATFSEAEKLVQIEMTAQDLAQAAQNWQQSLAGVYERRTGPKKLAIEDTIAPATIWNPTLPGTVSGPAKDFFVASSQPVPGLPTRDEDIAFAPVTHLSEWIKTRQIIFGAADGDLSSAAGDIRCEAALRDHADARARAATGAGS